MVAVLGAYRVASTEIPGGGKPATEAVRQISITVDRFFFDKRRYVPLFATLGTKYINKAWDVCVVDLKNPVKIEPASVGAAFSDPRNMFAIYIYDI